MDIQQFDYDLPEELIAQQPADQRSQSRLLNVAENLEDMCFSDLPRLLNPGDLLVTNNTKVIPARLFGRKQTGGKVEIMVERVLDTQHALAQLKTSKSVKPGLVIEIDNEINATVTGRQDEFFILEFNGQAVEQTLKSHGQIPLPPYIRRETEIHDLQRYQTVYAKKSGAVAAPTAGLHFDQQMLERLNAHRINRCEITLHVGAGTFKPVRVNDVRQHKMHAENFEIGNDAIQAIKQTQSAGGRIIAVGTTTVRALESCYQVNKLAKGCVDETRIFIYPGFEFKVVDALITNFHLPKSTLLMMVSAFAGYKRINQAYQHAIASKYRFFSYGDAMFLPRETNKGD